MHKTVFLTKVAEVMKGMISYEDMMASLQRSCMRAEAENITLMNTEEEEVNRVIDGITEINKLGVSEDILDVIVLKYLKNTQFLAKIKEDDIDTSGLAEDIDYWKKTLLYKAP